MRYFSCDSHVVEAAEIYDGLVDRFGSTAPYIEKDHQGKPGTWVVLPNGMRAITVGRLGIAGASLEHRDAGRAHVGEHADFGYI